MLTPNIILRIFTILTSHPLKTNKNKDHKSERSDRSFKPEKTFKPKKKKEVARKTVHAGDKPNVNASSNTSSPDDIRLNKYVAQCGIASRRAADELIQNGKIWVNGIEVREPGTRIKIKDRVTYQGKLLKPEQNMVYILMNKPKDTITTSNDEKGRKTVLDIVQPKIKERVYPIGRLDRMTTGLLILTNDGELAKTLSHPSSEVRKVYSAVLNKALGLTDLDKIAKGVELEDGKANIDGISYIDGAPKNEIGITLHSGKNRIVRRIFESLGYDVVKLDRVSFAGLTKKDLPRGHFRHLTEKEVTLLKHFGNRKKK